MVSLSNSSAKLAVTPPTGNGRIALFSSRPFDGNESVGG
jgi:hypothetical protein